VKETEREKAERETNGLTMEPTLNLRRRIVAIEWNQQVVTNY
jgi:hypothetical protein